MTLSLGLSLVGRWLAVVMLGLLVPVARAQAPAWHLAVAISTAGANSSEVTATAVDASGNVYVAGTFRGTAVFGATTLTSAGGDDLFVAKWNSGTGAFVWALRAGGADSDFASAVAVNGPNVYVAGRFFSALADFGSLTLTNDGGADVLVVKLIDAGSSARFIWANQAGSLGTYGSANAVAANGTDVYVAGAFGGGTMGFGSIPLTSGGGYLSMFVAKLADSGPSASFTWAHAAGSEFDVATAVAVRGTSVYVAGSFGSNAINFGSTTLTNTGDDNLFVAKLIDAGPTSNYAWARQVEGRFSGATGLAVSGSSVYVAGSFKSVALFGGPVLTAGGAEDAFVAKLGDTGNSGAFVWALRGGGSGSDYARAVAVSGLNVYVAGQFASTTAGFGSTSLVTAGSSDVFVAKLTDAGLTGSFAWAQRAGGGGPDQGNAVAVANGSVYLSGAVSPPANFGSQTLAAPVTIQSGFLADLTETTLGVARSGPLAEVALFPNPTHGAATVRVPSMPGSSRVTLTLADTWGRPVRIQCLSLPAAGITAELPLLGLAPGLYYLHVQAGNERMSRALTIE